MESDIISTSKKERKKSILNKSKDSIKNLTPVEQQEIGKFADELLETCSHLNNDDLSTILKVVAGLELSKRKSEFYEKLVNADTDRLNEIIDKESIDDAYLVLNELYNRLELIKKIDLLSDNPDTNEVMQLQALFKDGLWIFNPEYEGTRYTSNESLNKVIAELLGSSEKRPDFAVSDNSTVKTFSSYSYKKDSAVIDGYDEIIIIELKKGKSNITDKEMNQAVRYAKEIKRHDLVTGNTKIIEYVLGHSISADEIEPLRQGNITIYAKQYRTIVKTAKDRTFNLINQIKHVKGITDLGDNEINEVLKEDENQPNSNSDDLNPKP